MSHDQLPAEIFYECGDSLIHWFAALDKAVAESMFEQLPPCLQGCRHRQKNFIAATQQTFDDTWDARAPNYHPIRPLPMR